MLLERRCLETENECRRSLRAVPDRHDPYRQCPSGAAQLVRRPARRAGGSSCASTTPTGSARREDYARGIATDLAWLGIEPELVVRQSERIALYDAAADRLRAAGRLYACYETEDELDRRRKRQLARGLPPVYDRAAPQAHRGGEGGARSRGAAAALALPARAPHRRHGRTAFAGRAHVDTASLSDPVLVRGDGAYLYTLTSVVDDIDLGVTLVLRGEDHVTNTAVQIEIFEALGGPVPSFAHHNLLTTASGEGLSKRSGSLSIASLREDGLEPMAVASLAVLTGTAEAVRPVASLQELAELVDLATDFARAGALRSGRSRHAQRQAPPRDAL